MWRYDDKKNGMKQFCVKKIAPGTTCCGFVAHKNKGKVELWRPTYYVVSNQPSRNSGSSAFVDKCIQQEEVPSKARESLLLGEHTPQEWTENFNNYAVSKFTEETPEVLQHKTNLTGLAVLNNIWTPHKQKAKNLKKTSTNTTKQDSPDSWDIFPPTDVSTPKLKLVGTGVLGAITWQSLALVTADDFGICAANFGLLVEFVWQLNSKDVQQDEHLIESTNTLSLLV